MSLKTTDASAVIGPSRPMCLAVAVSADEGRSEIAGWCFSCQSPDRLTFGLSRNPNMTLSEQTFTTVVPIQHAQYSFHSGASEGF